MTLFGHFLSINLHMQPKYATGASSEAWLTSELRERPPQPRMLFIALQMMSSSTGSLCQQCDTSSGLQGAVLCSLYSWF